MNHRHMEATLLDWIRGVMETYHDWIESALGVPVERAIVFCVKNNLISLAAQRVLAGVPLTKLKIGPTVQLSERVEAVEFPRGQRLL